jgi:TolB protein
VSGQRRILAGLSALLVAGAVAALAHATEPGKNGKIAFSRYRLVDTPLWAEIYVVTADGLAEQKITHPRRGYIDEQPDWSPDGARLVFHRCPGNAQQAPCRIWSVRADGSGARRLTPDCSPGAAPSNCVAGAAGDDSHASYSPDGKHIAFLRHTVCCVDALTIADADLLNARSLLGVGHACNAPSDRPTWSPSGKQLAFLEFNWVGNIKTEPRNARAICIVNANGTGLHRLTPWKLKAGGQPDWSPDGTRILFRGGPGSRIDGGGNLYTIRTDGSALRQLTHFSRNPRVLQDGSYSPDGASIVFATNVGALKVGRSDLPDLFVMRSDGTHIQPITGTVNWDGSPDWGPSR